MNQKKVISVASKEQAHNHNHKHHHAHDHKHVPPTDMQLIWQSITGLPQSAAKADLVRPTLPEAGTADIARDEKQKLE